MHNDIKTALYKLMNSKNNSVVIPEKIREYLRKVYGHFSNRKTRDKFFKAFSREVEANQPRLQERKIAKARKDTYQKARLLGTALTNKCLDEFEEEYINNANSAIKEEEEEEEEEEAPTIKISPEAITSPMKKSCTLNKNKKKIVIFNTATYLISPKKSKTQYNDREQIKDLSGQ